mgnify:CR=1 FL=1
MKRIRSLSISLLICALATPMPAADDIYDICDYGAVPGGKTLCTRAIQKAIDACSQDGGGVVSLPAGRFLSGTIVLKSKVTLRLEAGCTLLGSTDLKDYPRTVPSFRSYTDNYTEKSLIYAEKAERIAIVGRGTIDGQGKAFEGPYKVRPYMIRIIECKDVVVEDVTIVDSPMWVQHYLACDDVRIDGIRVHSLVNHNNDGIDIDCCRRVTISNCNIVSGDDAIVLKSTADRVCRDVVVSNCVLSSRCNALKMGTESNGGFQNIVLSNCAIYETRLAGVALEIVDGGRMDRVVVSNITMHGVGAPIFVRLGNRARPFRKDMARPDMGVLRNVTISNIEARGADPTGCAISGLPEAHIENLTLTNLRLSFLGGGAIEQSNRTVPEKPESYPEYSMFGRLPAYGLYCRHVRGLRMAGVQLQFEKDDLRHAIVLDDVENVWLGGIESDFANGAQSVMQFDDVRGAIIRGCRPREASDLFLQVEGDSGGVMLCDNDLSNVERAVALGDGVPAGAVRKDNNLE